MRTLSPLGRQPTLSHGDGLDVAHAHSSSRATGSLSGLCAGGCFQKQRIKEALVETGDQSSRRGGEEWGIFFQAK